MLSIAASWIEQEKKDIVATKAAYIAEHCPPPSMGGDQNTLMVRRDFSSASILTLMIIMKI